MFYLHGHVIVGDVGAVATAATAVLILPTNVEFKSDTWTYFIIPQTNLPKMVGFKLTEKFCQG